jgi:hypothetical protein
MHFDKKLAVSKTEVHSIALVQSKPKTEIGICCFFAKHAALRRKSKDLLAQNQDNVSEWGGMSTSRLLFQ